MAQGDESRAGPGAGKDDFEGRDLLVGRPEEAAAGRPTAGAAQTPATTTSPPPGEHDDAIREILATVRATAARIDALQDAPGPGQETAEALAGATAALTQMAEDARALLGKAADARRDGTAEAARVLAQGAAAMKSQGEALDKRLRATGRQAEAVAEGMAEMKQAATVLDSSLRIHAENMFRITQNQRWRPWLVGLAIAAASFVFFSLGAVLQRETDVVSFGDPGHEWNDHVVEHYAPLLAICASKARLDDRIVPCQLSIDPSLEVTVPFYPGGTLSAAPSEGQFDPTADR